jgi:hypothetical protein
MEKYRSALVRNKIFDKDIESLLSEKAAREKELTVIE